LHGLKRHKRLPRNSAQKKMAKKPLVSLQLRVQTGDTYGLCKKRFAVAQRIAHTGKVQRSRKAPMKPRNVVFLLQGASQWLVDLWAP
jgi:hypothetical protein